MSRVSTASLNTVHQSRYSAAPESTDLFPSSVHLSATGAGGVLKFGPIMQPAPTNASPKTSEYSCQNPPSIPLGCEKIGGRPSRASGRTVKYLNLHGAIPFVVRLSNHERIFSQLPFFKGGIFFLRLKERSRTAEWRGNHLANFSDWTRG